MIRLLGLAHPYRLQEELGEGVGVNIRDHFHLSPGRGVDEGADKAGDHGHGTEEIRDGDEAPVDRIVG